MNKSTILLILLFITPFFVQGQEPEYGAKLGLIGSTNTGDNTDGLDTRVSPTGSVFIKVPLGSSFAFQPEIQYGSYGSTNVIDTGSTLRLNQIMIPLKLSFYPTINGNEDGFFVSAGPQIGFTVLDVLEVGTDRLDFGETVRELDGEFEPIDIGGSFNLGYEFDFGLWVETGAYHSIFPVWESSTGDKNFNAAASLTLGANLSTIFDDY